MADEQAEMVAMPLPGLGRSDIHSGLKAEEMAVELRRQRPAAAELGLRAEGAAPGDGKATVLGQQALLALALVEGAEDLQADEAGEPRQPGIDHRLRPVERYGRLDQETATDREERATAVIGPRHRVGCGSGIGGWGSGPGAGPGSGPGSGPMALRR